MDWEAVAAIAEMIGAIGVIATLAYLAKQIRSNTSALSAQARDSVSDFSFKISLFRAEHADRFAKLASGESLTAGDLEFRHWSHMQVMVHGEMYFYHFEIGLMPESHWSGYQEFVEDYVDSTGFEEFWAVSARSFDQGFREWIDQKLRASRSASNRPAA